MTLRCPSSVAVSCFFILFLFGSARAAFFCFVLFLLFGGLEISLQRLRTEGRKGLSLLEIILPPGCWLRSCRAALSVSETPVLPPITFTPGLLRPWQRWGFMHSCSWFTQGMHAFSGTRMPVNSEQKMLSIP